MSEIANLHEELLNFLLQWREQENAQGKPFTFGLRKSNRYNRLKDGLWFYGNDYYLALSFWTGMDWKNKTPTIYFVHTVDGINHLEISLRDSEIKHEFAKRFLAEPLNLEVKKGRLFKIYERGDLIGSLKQFLLEDKLIIDEILQFYQELIGSEFPDLGFGFIGNSEFEKRLTKVLHYRTLLSEVKPTETLDALRSFSINNFGPIKHLKVTDIPDGTQWIFLTGENGTGKTSILKGLATGLCRNNDDGEEIIMEYPDFLIDLSLKISDKIQSYRITPWADEDDVSWIPSGFAAYGASRLTTESSPATQHIVDKMEITGKATFGLFYDLGLLRELEGLYYKWSGTKNEETIKELTDYIRETVVAILPGISDITISDFGDARVPLYHEYDPVKNEKHTAVQFSDLSSGTKNIVALISDLLIRFYDQQPEIEDPSEFKGIVIIDEIDLHLHPSMQKQLIIELTNTFPAIQFIVTTHSPIPLLGAPKNSFFLKVERDRESGVTARPVDINISSLTPNLLLTSPIFGFSDLFNKDLKESMNLNTEDHWAEKQVHDRGLDALLKKYQERKTRSTND
ncbi:MAG: AAA family ATPase [Roseivirga sp.]|nr:AAA family ATPase [Roseivirga sp.]